MSDTLNITLVQTDIQWMSAKETLAQLDEYVKKVTTDLLVLPEMFATGFSMEVESIAEPMESSRSIAWMQEKAKKLNCAVCGSLSIKEKNKYYNRFVFVTPQGDLKTYDKKHLFSYGNEDKVYTSGKKIGTIVYKGFTLCPFVCYDLRFPVWSRNTQNYDVAIYVANWPAKRAFAWNALLTARAIENMCYVIGVNRLGVDGNHLEYQGDSKCIDPLGKQVLTCGKILGLKQFTLEKQTIIEVRNQYKFLEDRDCFTLHE